MIIAVDFDGTLCHSSWPGVEDLDLVGIYTLKEFKANGGRLILWTCRNGQDLQDAIDACAEKGLLFDAINENDPEHIKMWEAEHGESQYSSKVYADLYIDDKAMMTYEGIPWRRVHQYINGGDKGDFWLWYNDNRERFGSDQKLIELWEEYVGKPVSSLYQIALDGAPYSPFKMMCEERLKKTAS